MKPAGGEKPATMTDTVRNVIAAVPRRLWVLGGAGALAVIVAWLMFAPSREPVAPGPPSSGTAQTGGVRQSPQSAAAPGTAAPRQLPAFIRAVRLQPSLPTRLDSLKAEIEPFPSAPEGLSYSYVWKVNDRVVEDAAADTLNLSAFRKRNLVTVTVTPYHGDTAGLPVTSPVVAIQSVAPTLELKDVRWLRKTGEPVELQLVGAAPDGNHVTYSLEEPRVPGMTVDRSTGKITWRIAPDQKGVFRFGAAVEDDNKTKVTKVFEVTAQ